MTYTAIKHRFTGEIIHEGDYDGATEAVRRGLCALDALAHSKRLSEADLSRANLSEVDLSEVDLSRADLSGTNLSEVDLSGADLSGVNLSGANLSGANLSGANLSRANLYWANPSEADLSGANLSEANLSGANLSDVDLSGANLSGANLYWVNLSGAELTATKITAEATTVGARPLIQIGPIGSRGDILLAFITDRGIIVSTGCFTGPLEAFAAKVAETHGENDYAAEYDCAIALILCHASIYGI